MLRVKYLKQETFLSVKEKNRKIYLKYLVADWNLASFVSCPFWIKATNEHCHPISILVPSQWDAETTPVFLHLHQYHLVPQRLIFLLYFHCGLNIVINAKIKTKKKENKKRKRKENKNEKKKIKKNL